MKNNYIQKIQKTGFTLIELMIVIAIISLVSSIIFANLNEARERAKMVRAQAELKQITEAIIIAQGEQGGKPLITFAPAANCGQCYCSTLSSAGCLNNWKLALTQIETATKGLVTGLSKFEKDPWGNPYRIDGNQGEGGPTWCTTVDALGSYNKTISGLQPVPLAPSCP